MTAPVPGSRPALPTTLGWYRDAANWMVGLSTGALAAGLTYRDEIRATTQIPRFTFLLSALAFLVALIAGIRFYFWLTTYGNQRERGDRLRDEAQTTTDPEARRRLEKEATDADHKMQRAERSFGRLYYVLLAAFQVGIVGYAVSTIWLLSKGSVPTPPEPAWSLSVVPCCPAACRLPQPHILKIEKRTGETWYLTGDSTRPAVWKQVPTDGDGK